ncbi:hypothetical protein [Stenotrophomonas sp. 364]|uniref:hypothetical protein n=1 Tax=Stenotrophomonas sp. 364 TaxID=2691571 RepID=UPI0013178A3C|nr:hypothetical protein [Stenotrophomonas sp. 364]QHB73352.1 hypothetical protein GQ674_19600 [Stenotrophomonas sp. 364]
MRWFALLLLLALSAPGAAQADEIRCLTGGSRAQIHLSWKLPAEGQRTSYVRYAGKTAWLRLTLLNEHSTEMAEGRPWQFDTVWEEHLDGKVIGRYAISTQGARIYGFDYTNGRTGRQTAFSEDIGALSDTGCRWD